MVGSFARHWAAEVVVAELAGGGGSLNVPGPFSGSKFILATGTLLSLLIAAAFVASGWVRMAYQVIDGPFALTSMGVLVVGIDDQFPGGIFVERNPRW